MLVVKLAEGSIEADETPGLAGPIDCPLEFEFVPFDILRTMLVVKLAEGSIEADETPGLAGPIDCPLEFEFVAIELVVVAAGGMTANGVIANVIDKDDNDPKRQITTIVAIIPIITLIMNYIYS
jgi:hypothetical protein